MSLIADVLGAAGGRPGKSRLLLWRTSIKTSLVEGGGARSKAAPSVRAGSGPLRPLPGRAPAY
jgi:hypothetical protein